MLAHVDIWPDACNLLSGPATEHAARIRSDGHAIFARCYTARAQSLIFFQVSELLCYKADTGLALE